MPRPKEMQEVLEKVLKGLKPPGGKVAERLQKAWEDVMKGKEARQSRVKQLKKGVLLVEVDSAPMLHYIAGQDKQRLLATLRERVEGIHIQEIRMRLAKE